MPFYEYKVVPLPEKTPKVRGLKGAPLFSHGLQTLMNTEAQDGWEYLRAESLPDEERKGLMGTREMVTRNVLVFRRELYYEEPADTETEAPLSLNRTARVPAPEATPAKVEADTPSDLDRIYAGAEPEPYDTEPAETAEKPSVRRPLFGERKDPS